MITIALNKKLNKVPLNKRKCLFLQARAHAAETVGSFVMRELIRLLTQDSAKFEQILANYVIKLVPMINPDGVTFGNARSSLVGVDLNRRWAKPHCIVHPEIYYLKQIIKDSVGNKGKSAIFIDVHGHNKKENCFFYGCNKASDEGLLSWTKTRLLPKIFAKNEKIFEFSSCSF